MRWIILCLLTALLAGCTTVRYVPVVKKGARAKVPPELLEPSRRPVKRSPANTPLLEAGRQWLEDRRLAGDEADRADSLRAFVCAERNNVVRNRKGENVCAKLAR